MLTNINICLQTYPHPEQGGDIFWWKQWIFSEWGNSRNQLVLRKTWFQELLQLEKAFSNEPVIIWHKYQENNLKINSSSWNSIVNNAGSYITQNHFRIPKNNFYVPKSHHMHTLITFFKTNCIFMAILGNANLYLGKSLISVN